MSPSLEHARTLIGLRRPQEAEQVLRSLLAQNPDDAAALRALAEALGALERYDEQESVARSAVAREPDNHHGHLILANALIHSEKRIPAVDAAEQSTRLAPASPNAHYTLARAHLTGPNGQIFPAMRAVDEALRLAPHFSHAHNLRGLCLSRLGHREDAARSYKEALRLDPGNAHALNNLAALNINQGRLRSASSSLTSGLAVDPQLSLLHRNYDAILLKLISRLRLPLLGLGGVLIIMSFGGAPYVVRLTTAALLFSLYTFMTWQVARRLPRGAHLWTRGLLRRIGGRNAVRVVALLIVTCLVFALGVSPDSFVEGIAMALWYLILISGVLATLANPISRIFNLGRFRS